jgi:hypothetical protein
MLAPDTPIRIMAVSLPNTAHAGQKNVVSSKGVFVPKEIYSFPRTFTKLRSTQASMSVV